MIKKICEYLKQCKCEHDYSLILNAQVFEDESKKMPVGKRIVYRCNKCGHVQDIKL